MTPRLVVPADELPVSVEAVKHDLRITDDDEDAAVERYIQAAVNYLEPPHGPLGCVLMPQTWEMSLGSFQPEMRLPIGPVMQVAAVKYTDDEGDEQTVSSGVYSLETHEDGMGYIVLAPGATWPSGPPVIRWVAGHEECPVGLQRAVSLLAGFYYNNREADPSISVMRAVRDHIAPWRGFF